MITTRQAQNNSKKQNKNKNKTNTEILESLEAPAARVT